MGSIKKFILFITYDDQMIEYVLPGMNDRKYMLNLYNKTGIEDMEVSLEVWDGKWYICSNSLVRISREHKVVQEQEISAGLIFNGKIYKSGFRFQVRIGQLDKEQTGFYKYMFAGTQTINTGQDASCHFSLSGEYISKYHATIVRQGSSWYLEDHSTNGTYVNGRRINRRVELQYADEIGVMDFKFIFLEKVIAVNHNSQLQSRLSLVQEEQVTQKTKRAALQWFSRSPRFIEPLDIEELEIEAPPAVSKKKKMPLYLMIGPSITMPIPILVMVLFNVAVNSTSNPINYMGMAISVILFAAMGIMWTMLRKNYEESMEIEEGQVREQSYRNYIEKNEQLILQKETTNKRILENTYVSSARLLSQIQRQDTFLWNRNINHEDFLTVRIGVGAIKSPNELKIPKQRFSLDDDALADLPRQVYERHEMMVQTPKTLDLREHKIIGVIGEKSFLNQMSNSLIIQVAALHSYLDVKMVFLMGKGEWEREWSWVKWLPHTFSQNKKVRYVSDNDESYDVVQHELIEEIKRRTELEKQNQNDGKKTMNRTHYLIFVTNREQLHNSSLYQYMVSDKDYGITFILLYGELSRLPNECKYILENTQTYSGAYQLDKSIGRVNMLQFEGVSSHKAEPFARSLNKYVIQELGQSELPETIDYLSMIGIGKLEQWNLLKHYKENRSFEGIRSFIGIMPGNKPMYLDIHEKKFGPHGLIAGTTGSGKSELIQTFILSLALNYHPSEVAFILIDYKGGGMANLFQGIPHVAGMILNLNEDGEEVAVDQNQTRRMLLSIRSELKRREKIFNRYKVNKIDDYMRLYREGKATEPLPHLIIISDEFAELKKEQPEFIKELVSTARVGRSIGVHLILATQKPAGVVDDEIFSNSRFKICLRVQDKTDSNEMLKRPEAAWLSVTGRAYFQLGNNEIFEMFQSGYSGAEYEPKEEVASADDQEVNMITITGIPAVVLQKQEKNSEESISQIKACIDYIKVIANENGIAAARPLWLPALSKEIDIHDINVENIMFAGSIKAVVGMIDNPESQSQYPYYIDFSEFSNLMIVGNQGCGKSTFIQTILYSMAMNYHSDDVNFYILDFSSGLLHNFMKLPHCGNVAQVDEEDSVNRTIRYLISVIEERNQIFKKAGVGGFWEFKKISKEPMPLLLLVIDNYFAFGENYESLEGDITTLLRSGFRCGIQVIVSANRMNDMKFRLRQNITRVVPLQLNERMDYMEALGSYLAGFTATVRGRGLCKEEEILEFQTALVSSEKTEYERIRKVSAEFEAMAKTEKYHARSILVLPENETYGEFLEKMPEEMLEDYIPIGYEQKEIQPYTVSLKESFCYLISGIGRKGVDNLLENTTEYLAATENLPTKKELYLVHLNKNCAIEEERAEAVYKNDEDIFSMLLFLKEEFTKRNKWRKEYLAEGKEERLYSILKKEFAQLFFIIDDFTAFLELVYKSHGTESYFPITELFFKEGKGLGIYFIAGIDTGNSASAVYTQAYKNFTNEKKGIHLGGQLNQQNLFQFQIPITKQLTRLDDNIGCFVEKETPYSVFIPWNQSQ